MAPDFTAVTTAGRSEGLSQGCVKRNFRNTPIAPRDVRKCGGFRECDQFAGIL
jgi:hypothetical protein